MENYEKKIIKNNQIFPFQILGSYEISIKADRFISIAKALG